MTKGRIIIKKFKKIMAMGLAAIMTLSLMCTGAFAENIDTNNNISAQSDSSNIIEVSGNDISIQYDVSIESDDNIIDNNMAFVTEDDARIAFGTAGFSVIRDGNTSRCEVYIYWNAQFLVSGWSFDSVPVVNYNTYVPYDTIGGSWVPCTMQTSGSVYVTDVTIPTNVTRVKVKGNNLRAYCPTYDSMTDTLLSNYQNVTIN